MSQKHSSKSKKSAKLVKLLSTVAILASFSFLPPKQVVAQSEMVSDPVIDVRIEQMKNMLTRLLEIDEAREEQLNEALNEIEALKSDQSKVSDLEVKLSKATQKITALTEELTNLKTINEDMSGKLIEKSDEISELSEKVDLNTEYRQEKIKIERYNVLEDNQGIAKLVSLSDLSEITANLPISQNCSEVGEWFVSEYLARSRNSFYVVEATTTKVCDYENGNWLVREAKFNGRSHVIDIAD
jgi:predicted RNase H-like nuclease (RuvC/YqgF family)